jgi:hypothetical protein
LTAVHRLKPGLLEQCPDEFFNVHQKQYHAAAGAANAWIWQQVETRYTF